MPDSLDTKKSIYFGGAKLTRIDKEHDEETREGPRKVIFLFDKIVTINHMYISVHSGFFHPATISIRVF